MTKIYKVCYNKGMRMRNGAGKKPLTSLRNSTFKEKVAKMNQSVTNHMRNLFNLDANNQQLSDKERDDSRHLLCIIDDLKREMGKPHFSKDSIVRQLGLAMYTTSPINQRRIVVLREELATL